MTPTDTAVAVSGIVVLIALVFLVPGSLAWSWLVAAGIYAVYLFAKEYLRGRLP